MSLRRPRSPAAASICLALLLAALAHPSIAAEPEIPSPEIISCDFRDYEISHRVHAFYYPWYGNPPRDGAWRHWNHQTLPHWTESVNSRFPSKVYEPPEDIGAAYYPELGAYSCQDQSILRSHMSYLRRARVGVIALSWYPPGLSDDGFPQSVDSLVPLILEVAWEYHIHVTFHLEPYENRSASSLRRDIVYIMDHYGTNPAFYRHQEKPLLYVYDSYKLSVADWQSLLSPEGLQTIRGTPYDAQMIGLFLRPEDCELSSQSHFDGFYTYFSSQGFSYGSSPEHWNEMRACSTKRNLLFIPSIGPGYNDTKLRPWNEENTRSRNGGAYYRSFFVQALQGDFVSITSFNEWGEGTQIEPAQSKMGYSEYEDESSFLYLDITKEFVDLYLSQKGKDFD